MLETYARDLRLDRRVDQRRHRALVLAVLAQHVAGDRDDGLGVLAAQDLAHPQLVVGVGVGVQEADADRGDAVVTEPVGGGDRGVLVEGTDLVALEVEPAADGADHVGRDDARRLHPEVGVAVAVGHGLAGDLEDELVALGRDEAELLDLALEELVGGDGRAVAHGGHVGAARPHQVEHLVDAVDEAVGRVGGGGRRLGGDQLTGRLVEGDDVGERASGVDADANASGGLRHGAPRAGVGNRVRRPRCGA